MLFICSSSKSKILNNCHSQFSHTTTSFEHKKITILVIFSNCFSFNSHKIAFNQTTRWVTPYWGPEMWPFYGGYYCLTIIFEGDSWWFCPWSFYDACTRYWICVVGFDNFVRHGLCVYCICYREHQKTYKLLLISQLNLFSHCTNGTSKLKWKKWKKLLICRLNLFSHCKNETSNLKWKRWKKNSRLT